MPTTAGSILLFVMRVEGGLRSLRTRYWKLHVCRGLLIVAANSCFYLALAVMPLAETLALFFVAPLFITVMSIAFLGERVGARRWGAIVVGLVGMVVMLRPGAGVLNWVALLPVVAALAYSSMQILTRRIGLADPASIMAFYIQVMFVLVSSTVGLVAGSGQYAGGGHPSLEFLLRVWVWPPAGHLAVFILVGALNAAGAYLMSQAYRTTRASLVAPFEYVALPLGLLWGWMLWQDFPDGYAFIGTALIIGSGLYIIYRETLLRQQARH